ncbi:UNVERIFIED_CONTAM: hypothetical protein Sangu_0382900 [Sesamum angustifolium]|uniref:Uncharacterized protein n=1 Tax=Sesamum angustifolium TaxID=2727405 RepID=A0AAW2QS36_9LAMI
MEHITITVLQAMPSTWRSRTALVIHTVIRRHKSCCSCFLIQYGGSTATLPSREMVGSEMAEPGSSTLEAFPVDFISTRIQVALLQEEYGPLLTWELKFLSVIRTKWLNGLSVTSMSF